MSEYTTAARPYAKAAFEVAQAESKQAEWLDAIQLISAIVCNEAYASIIDSPKLGAADKGDILIDICADKLSDTQKNFVRTLSENARLALMPEIAVLFEALKAQAEGTVEATATSAYPLSDAQVKSMTEALKKKLGREVSLTTEVDASLIGGVVIRAGDLVIDGSTRARIGALTQAVAH